MEARYPLRRSTLSAAVLLMLAACGGGSSDGGSSNEEPPAVVPTTTDVTITVVDGAITNALVCTDKNANNDCDADETQDRTDAAGKVTLAVPNADVGKFAIVAVVGTDAVDVDHGAVTTPYKLSAPAARAGLVNPLTTLVQQSMALNGVTLDEAVQSVQDATGLTVSLFEDFTKPATPPPDGTISAAAVARLLVVTAQQQSTLPGLATTVGTPAADGTTITQAGLDRAIQSKLIEMLPALVNSLADPAVLAATAPGGSVTTLRAAADALVASDGLTLAAVPVIVAVNTQAAPTTPPPARVATAGYSLDTLSFTDADNHFSRTLGSSVAHDTPDAANLVRYVERRTRTVAGNVARWGSGSDPWRAADLNWNGTAWVSCPLNNENTAGVLDAQGVNAYGYCDKRETGKSKRASIDVAGKPLLEIYNQIVAGGFTNLTIADPAAALGSAVFPAGAQVQYQTKTPLTTALSYYAGGADSPPGTSNVVLQYSPAVSAGGTASAQPAGTACNSPETAVGGGSNTTTLDGLIATKTGTPCVYGQGSFVYGGVTYTSDTPNEWWGQGTVWIGVIGSARLNSGAAPGYYSGNTGIRMAFNGTGTNPVTYYACKQRFTDGSSRNCTPIGTGSYTIATLGDARVMTLTNPPAAAAPLTYNRVFVERGGLVYFGYQVKPQVTSRARLNTIAATALLSQLGMTPTDPSTPFTLSAGSYTGIWDLRNAGTAPGPLNGTTVFINSDGSSSCQDRESGSYQACTVTITNAASGAFSLSDNIGPASGSFDHVAGTASGSFEDATSTPPTGTFVGGRR
jgi:hypothetical protein